MLAIRMQAGVISSLKFGKFIKVHINTHSFWSSTFCYRIFPQSTIEIHLKIRMNVSYCSIIWNIYKGSQKSPYIINK